MAEKISLQNLEGVKTTDPLSEDTVGGHPPHPFQVF